MKDLKQIFKEISDNLESYDATKFPKLDDAYLKGVAVWLQQYVDFFDTTASMVQYEIFVRQMIQKFLIERIDELK